MDNNEVNELIDAFVGYREMLVPIQQDMHDFLSTYDALKSDIQKVDEAFSGDVQKKLSEIYGLLSSQAEKSAELTRKVDQFLKSSTKYTEEVDKLISTFENINSKIKSVNDIEEKANEQIGRLDAILEEKKRSYNLKDLEKSLDSYNANLQNVSDFINNKVADNIVANSKTIQSVKDGNENILKRIENEGKTIADLVSSYNATNQTLKKIVDKQDVNEAYIFDILDQWAEERGVKMKK